MCHVVFPMCVVLFLLMLRLQVVRIDHSYDSVNHQQWLTWNSRRLSQYVTGKQQNIKTVLIVCSMISSLSETMCRAIIDFVPWMVVFMILGDGDSFVKASYLDCAGRPRSRRGR